MKIVTKSMMAALVGAVALTGATAVAQAQKMYEGI